MSNEVPGTENRTVNSKIRIVTFGIETLKKGVNKVVDWYYYAEAKRREQERIDEAQAWYLQRSFKVNRVPRVSGLRMDFLMWLGGRLIASGTKLQTQFR